MHIYVIPNIFRVVDIIELGCGTAGELMLRTLHSTTVQQQSSKWEARTSFATMHASACWCVALGGLLLATSSVADAQSTHTRSLRHRGPAPKRGPELASDADFAALFSDSHPSDGNSGNYGDQSPGSYAIPPVAPPPSLDPGPSTGTPSADAPPPTALPQGVSRAIF